MANNTDNVPVANSEQEQHRVHDVAEEETELIVAAIYKVGTLLLPQSHQSTAYKGRGE